MDNLLEGLTLKQKRALRDQLEYELRPSAKSAVISTEEQDLWDCMNEALGVSGRRLRPLSGFIELTGAAKYKDAAEFVDSFVHEGSSAEMRRPAMLSVKKSVLGCLAEHLTARNIPATPSVMLKSLGTLSFAVEQRFPGYHAVRFLDRVAPIAAHVM